MKKLSFLFILTAMFAFVACGPSAEKKAKEVETEVEEVLDVADEVVADEAVVEEEAAPEQGKLESKIESAKDQKDSQTSGLESAKKEKPSSKLGTAQENE